MNKINNFTTTFYLLSIAMLLLGLSGCGYKKAPYYEDQSSDDKVDFIIKKPIEN